MFAIKQFAESVVPRKYLRVLGLYVTKTMAFFMKGDKLECTICGYKGNRFLSYGLVKRENALCPNCLSLERHRLLWLYFKEKTDIFTKPKKVLHFAPEFDIQTLLKKQKNLDYTSCDIDMPTAMEKQDITNITHPDNTFDVILCNHVLEHIRDDHKAMSELYRVMRPGGWAILQTPMNNQAQVTDEDITLTDPKEMQRRFGQNDHVRVYGLDKKDRLEKVGFRVVVDKYVAELPLEKQQRYALDTTEDIYLCFKD